MTIERALLPMEFTGVPLTPFGFEPIDGGHLVRISGILTREIFLAGIAHETDWRLDHRTHGTCSSAAATSSPTPEPSTVIEVASSPTHSPRSSEPRDSRSSRPRSELRSRTPSQNAGSARYAVSSSIGPSSGTSDSSRASSSTTSSTTTLTDPTGHSINSQRRARAEKWRRSLPTPVPGRQIHPLRLTHQRIQKRRLTSHDRVSGTHRPPRGGWPDW